MLSVQPLKSAKGAADYYTAAFNYYANDAQALRWLGQGSEHLQLAGVVEKEQMLALLQGHLPNGQVLQNKKGEHRPGFDMTFSAPKSVSILAGLGADSQLEVLHDLAVEKAIRLIEQEFAQARVVIEGKVHYVNTGNLVIAAFRQPSSRANDPALHTHCVTMNLTFTKDGKARSLASDIHGQFGVIEQLQQQVTYAGLLYRTELANLLKAQGYRLIDVGNGLFEIEGLPEEVLQAFSTRRADIEALMQERGWEGARLASHATLLTRNQKEEHDIALLRQHWQERAQGLGFNAEEFVKQHKALTQELVQPKFLSALKDKLFSRFYEKPDLERLQAKEAVFVAIEILAQQESVFHKRQLKELALRHSLTGKTQVSIAAIDQSIETAVKNQTLYQATDPITKQAMLTTPWALTLETETLARLDANKNSLTPIANREFVLQAQNDFDAQSSFPLTPSQKQAMLHVFSTKDRFNAIQGYAGTGKTTLLKLTTELAISKGFTVRGLAVTSSAVNELRTKAQINADVFPIVQQELIRARDNSLRKTLFILDEASMLSTIQGHELIKLIEQKGARLFLIGDDAQLSSVKCGRIFGQSQEYGLQTSELTDIIRQNNLRLKESVEDVLRGDLYDSLQKLNEVRTYVHHEERIAAVAKSWLLLSPPLRDKTLVFAPTHTNRRDITAIIREELKQEGTLTGQTVVLNTLKAKMMEEVQFHYTHYYQEGDVLRFNVRLPQSRIRAGDYFTIGTLTAKHRKTNTVPLLHQNGSETTLQLKELPTYKPTRAGLTRLIECYEPTSLELCEHDKVLITRNNKASGLVNSSLARVKSITDGNITLQFELEAQEKTFPLDAPELKHLDHGYVLTTMKAQGKDKTYAIGLLESYNQFSATLKQYYVQISRAISRMTLITDDRTRLLQALEFNEDSKTTALGFTSIDTVKNHQQRFAVHPKALSIAGIIEQKEKQDHQQELKQTSLRCYKQAKEAGKSAVAAFFAYRITTDSTSRRMAHFQLRVSETTLRQDALIGATCQLQSTLNREEQTKLFTVKAYVLACQQTQKAWQSVYSGNNSELQKKIALALADERNALAFEIAEQIEAYKPYLQHFSIGTLNRLSLPQHRIEETEARAVTRLHRLSQHAEKHQLSLAIAAFFKEDNQTAKEKLGFTLHSQSKAVHPYLIRFSESRSQPVNELWREINQQATAYKDKTFRTNLSEQEKTLFDRIKTYQTLNRELATHYKDHLYLLEKGKNIPESYEQKQNELSLLRNELAALVINNTSVAKLLHYFKVDADKLNRHAANHDKRQTVLDFKSQANFKLKQKAALDIAEDFKGHYPFIKALDVNTKSLNTLIRIEERKLTLASLSESERTDYQKLLDYKVTQRQAGQAWKAIFLREEQGQSLEKHQITHAQALTAKRDSLAHWLQQKKELASLIEQERLNPAKIAKQATQHQARLTTLTELHHTKEKRLSQLRHREPQMNKQEASDWHQDWKAFNKKVSQVAQNSPLYQNAINETGLSPFIWTKAEQALLNHYELETRSQPTTRANPQSPTTQTKPQPKERLDANLIIEAMMVNPEETYRAIWGEPKKVSSREMRYSGGLVVSLKGSKAGLWYDFSQGIGGNPIQALIRERGLSFNAALKEAATLIGLPDLSAPLRQTNYKTLTDSEEEKLAIISAKSILKGGTPIQGTLAERYLNAHRGIEHPNRLKVLFWPKGASWQASDDKGNLYPKINKIPALLIAAKNEKGEITGVQRIYLDEKTGQKNTFMDNAKLSKGKIAGSCGLLQKGEKQGTLYLVEGPETGASVAMANPKATVLVAFGLANLKNLSPIIKRFFPKEIIIAGDNDTLAKSNTLKQTEQAQTLLQNQGINAKLIIPAPLPGKEKTDWNDVHRACGLASLRQQLGLSPVEPSLHEGVQQFTLQQEKQAKQYLAHYRQLKSQQQQTLRIQNEVTTLKNSAVQPTRSENKDDLEKQLTRQQKEMDLEL